MPQNKIQLGQIDSGKDGVEDIGARLAGVDTEVDTLQEDLDTAEQNIVTLQNDLDLAEADIVSLETDAAGKAVEIAKVNETVMAMASSPVSTPVFNDVANYTILAADITAGQPVVVTIPGGKTYKVGKGNLMVLRNGVHQVGSYTEASATTVSFEEGEALEGDIITFIIGNASKLNYNMAVVYYATGDHSGKIQTVTYTGDIERTITYTYNTDGKIATEVIDEGDVTTTKTYNYDGTSKKIVSIAAVVA